MLLPSLLLSWLDSLGSKTYWSRAASTLICALVYPCIFQYVDTSVLPTKLRFNVSVWHGLMSNHDAYDVALDGGSQDLQIYWAERGPDDGPRPSDPELTVTDDVFWKWKENVLGQDPVTGHELATELDRSATEVHGNSSTYFKTNSCSCLV